MTENQNRTSGQFNNALAQTNHSSWKKRKQAVKTRKYHDGAKRNNLTLAKTGSSET